MMNYENEQTIQTKDSMENCFFRASAADFKKIPGSPIVYWASKNLLSLFEKDTLEEYAAVRQGMATTDNERFLRGWHELSLSKIGIGYSTPAEGNANGFEWFVYNKGGEYRKWYGNFYYVVNYANNGQVLIDLVRDKYPKISDPEFVIKNRSYYCKEAITWSDVSSGATSFRYVPKGMLFDGRGSCIFTNAPENTALISLLNTPVTLAFAKLLNPTVVLNPGEIKKLPVLLHTLTARAALSGSKLIQLSKTDWDFFEVSLDFNFPSLLTDVQDKSSPLILVYQKLRSHWLYLTEEMQRLEEENNRIFIEAYGLQDELTSIIPLKEITLTCNPHYRYGGDKTEEELEALLLADTMREFISYAVGCMFGRYSLDKPGLVLANQGETLTDYLAQVPNPSFTPDQDNVIPILDGDWFADDITERFRQFLRITFGDEHYDENLTFIEDAIGKDIRKFFLRDFYNDHVKRYKKRPIYWLFSSPKGTFNALVYLHRYRPDTVSVVLGYLRDFRHKLDAHLKHLEQVSISTDASQAEKTRALKEIDNLKKQLLELDDYEHDTLYPLATQQITIDLDDGVKANYPKFGSALKRIVGLDAKDDD